MEKDRREFRSRRHLETSRREAQSLFCKQSFCSSQVRDKLHKYQARKFQDALKAYHY